MNYRLFNRILVFVLCTTLLTGCNLIYQARIEKAYSKLRIGMDKGELDKLFEDFEFLEDQTVLIYPASRNSIRMKKYLAGRYYETYYPKDIFEKLTFDGNIKILNYYVKSKYGFPNGWDIYYFFVFYNKIDDKVIGWGKSFSGYNASNRLEDIRKNWPDKF